MPTQPASDPRYPIGDFVRPAVIDAEYLDGAIAILAALPENLRAAVYGLTDFQIDTPYREGGWTVRQLVHHVADSHMNAYVRTRLALTEDWPTIKPYEEKLWAELADARTLPVEVSLELLEPLHRRWVALLESLTARAVEARIQPSGERQAGPCAGDQHVCLALPPSRGAYHGITKE